MIDLKEEIKSRGLTQDQFAQKAGVNRSTVQKAMYGYYVKPETAQKFCDALCIPYDPEDWCLRQRKPTEKPISRNITDKTIEHFKNGLKVGQNIKVPYNAQSTDSRKNKILKARLVGMFDTWGLVEIKLKSGLKIKKGFCYTDIKRCSK